MSFFTFFQCCLRMALFNWRLSRLTSLLFSALRFGILDDPYDGKGGPPTRHVMCTVLAIVLLYF